jgi:hypothetical protein
MFWKTGLLAAVAVIALAAGPQGGVNTARAACDAGERIDGSTAASAKRAMEAKGYTQVRDLKKGCDNYWHAIATQGGATVRIVLSPQGDVVTEGN